MATYRKKPVTVEAEQFWPDKPLPFRDRGPVVGFDGDFYVTTIHGERANLAPGRWAVVSRHTTRSDARARLFKLINQEAK